jgi:hypothetical protein
MRTIVLRSIVLANVQAGGRCVTEQGDGSKPAHIFDREAEWNGLAAFAGITAPNAMLGLVSGRRRMGKTCLLRSLVEQRGGFYFGATAATEAESLASSALLWPAMPPRQCRSPSPAGTTPSPTCSIWLPRPGRQTLCSSSWMSSPTSRRRLRNSRRSFSGR